MKVASKKFDDDNMVKYVEENDVLENGFLRNVLNYVLLRERFSYGYKELVHYLSNCYCIRRPNKESTDHKIKKHILYKTGSKKLEKELDVVNLIRSIR